MNDAHGQRPDDLIETQPPEHTIHPTHWCPILSMAMYLGTVTVGMAMNVVSVSGGMRVLRGMQGRNCLRYPAHDPGQIQNSQKNQHQANRQFHCETNPRWNDKTEQDDSRT